MEIKSITQKRAVLNQWKNVCKNTGVIPSFSTLRLETALATQAVVKWNVTAGTGPQSQNATEIRLQIADAFVAIEMFVGLIKLPTAGNIASCILQTFPNSGTFSGSNEAILLMNLYNGYFTIKVNQTTWIDKSDVMKFYRVGMAQKGIVIFTAGTYFDNQWDQGDWGFHSLEDTITLDGGSNNDVNVSCPQPLNMAGTSSTNYAVCMFRGILLQNGGSGRNLIDVFNPSGIAA